MGGSPVDESFASGPRIDYQVGLEVRHEDGGGVRCGGSIVGTRWT